MRVLLLAIGFIGGAVALFFGNVGILCLCAVCAGIGSSIKESNT